MNESRWYGLLLGILATWRVAHLLRSEEGPWHILAKVRKRLSPWFGGVLGELFACFYCFSVWIALPAALLLGHTWTERFWLWPALSAGAILLERIIVPATPWYSEDPPKEDAHELLRTAESEPERPSTPHDPPDV